MVVLVCLDWCVHQSLSNLKDLAAQLLSGFGAVCTIFIGHRIDLIDVAEGFQFILKIFLCKLWFGQTYMELFFEPTFLCKIASFVVGDEKCFHFTCDQIWRLLCRSLMVLIAFEQVLYVVTAKT